MSTLHHIAHRTKKLPPLRVGIGGPVGSGKTTLLEMLCKAMRDKYDLVAITNDIYTKEDQRLLTVSGALAAERIMGVETGGCPHTAIREDASINLEAIDRMLVEFPNADTQRREFFGALRDVVECAHDLNNLEYWVSCCADKIASMGENTCRVSSVVANACETACEIFCDIANSMR